MDAVMQLYQKIMNKQFLVRRINITANNVVDELTVEKEKSYQQIDLFTNYQEKVERRQEELTEKELQKAMNKIQIIKEQISTRPTISFTYFIPDLKKDGGKYVTVTGIVRKIDEYRQIIILEDKTEIPINEIISILGTIVEIDEKE